MNFTVERYDIFLDLNRGKEEYQGKVSITLKGDAENLQIDAKGLTINSISQGGNKFKFTHDREKWKAKIAGRIESGKKLDIEFTNRYSEGLQGLYRAGRGDEEILTTQFEPNSARDMIPCIDDPSYKAVFSLKLRIGKGLTAISNMPVRDEKVVGESKEVQFEDTPRMSTYLLYLGVGKFTSKSKKLGNREIILSVPGNDLKSDDFPIDTAIKVIQFYEKYFEIPYALPKMHLISVPDFAAGAMENWGAITFREVVLLTNESSDTETRIRVAEVIAHEIAHQWFGDLVTMKWWNDLWLNESFATFMSYLCVDTIYPEFEVWKAFYQGETLWAMGGDALKSSHPIQVEVKDPSEIQQIFDEISYGKGGSILRMMEQYVGHEKFRKGIAKYLSDFKYSNAEGLNFWQHIEEASGLPVVRTTEKWLGKMGYPLITVKGGGDSLILDQSQYLLDGSSTDQLWPIPVIVKRKGKQERLLMEKKQEKISAKDFLKLNSDASGFFRTRYPADHYARLGSIVGEISDIDIAEILSDANSFFIRGDISQEEFFRIIDSLTGRVTTPAVNLVATNLSSLSLILSENGKFRDHTVEVLRRLLKLLGEKKKGESKTITIARNTAMETLALFDMEYSKDQAKHFGDYFSLDPDIRAAVALSKARTSKNLDDLLAVYEKATLDEDRNRLITAFGWVDGKINHDKIMEMLMEGKIKKQDAPAAVVPLMRNPESRAYMFDQFEDIVSYLRKVFEGSGYASNGVQISVPLLGLGRVDQMKAKLKKVEGPDITRGISKGLETLEIYEKLRKRVG